MATISSINAGQTSSVQQLVDQYMAIERKPVDDLESSKSGLSQKINIYSDLKTKLKSLRDMMNKFTGVGANAKFGAKIATSSNAKVFTVESTADASVGVSSLFVSRLATRDTAISKRYSNLNGTSLADKFYETTQTFDITVGSNDPVRISLEFNDANETKEGILNRIVDAINASDADVTASYINDTPETARITMMSNEPGSTNQISFEEIDGSNILRKLNIITNDNLRPQSVDTGGGFLVTDPNDLNAQITLNGIEITKDSNTIDDVLDGITIKLLSTQAEGENPETLSVSYNNESIKSEIESFIESYNEVIKYLNEKTSVDTTTYTRGALAGSFSYTNLKIGLRSIISGPVGSVQEGAPFLLSQIGIEIARDGTLKIGDDDKLQEYIDKGNTDISDLFNSENGIANKVNEKLKSYVDTGGYIDDDKNLINRRIKNIDSRIASMETRLRIREDTLWREFASLQEQLSSLNSQQSILQNSMFNYYGGYSTGSLGY